MFRGGDLLATCATSLVLLASSSIEAQSFAAARVTDATIAADGALVAFTLRAPDGAADRFASTVMTVPASGGPTEPLAPGWRPAFAPSGTAIARLAMVDGRPTMLVRDAPNGTDRVLTGAALQVRAFRWSPDGLRFAFTAEPAPAEFAGLRVERGTPRSRQALFIVDAAGGEPRRVTPDGFTIGPADAELADLVQFDWLDNTRLVVSGRAAGDAEGPHAASLHVIDVASGGIRYLAGVGGRWHLPVVSPNRDWIAFTGQPLGPAGWMADEVIILRPDGSGLRRLTAGRDLDALDLRWSSDSRQLWFALEERGSRNIARVDVRNGRLAAGTTGTHLMQLQAIARRGAWALAIRATPGSAGSLVRFPLDRPHELTVLADVPSPAAAAEVEELDLEVPGVRSLHGWLVRPPAFDGSRPWPVLIDLHGGPHAMAAAGYAPNAMAHAAAGRLVLRLNPRGSTGFGFDLANGLGDRWPGADLDDVRAAIDALIERGLVDSTRIAVVGTGAGAATAMALRAVEPRIRATILRCADGDWVMGDGGVDQPLWSEWHTSRPFAQVAPRWWRNFGMLVAGNAGSPLLVIEGEAASPRTISMAEAMHVLAASRSTFVRIPAACRDAGPVTQQRLFEMERDFLQREG